MLEQEWQDPANVPVPVTGRSTFFFNALDGGKPYIKVDSMTWHKIPFIADIPDANIENQIFTSVVNVSNAILGSGSATMIGLGAFTSGYAIDILSIQVTAATPFNATGTDAMITNDGGANSLGNLPANSFNVSGGVNPLFKIALGGKSKYPLIAMYDPKIRFAGDWSAGSNLQIRTTYKYSAL